MDYDVFKVTLLIPEELKVSAENSLAYYHGIGGHH